MGHKAGIRAWWEGWGIESKPDGTTKLHTHCRCRKQCEGLHILHISFKKTANLKCRKLKNTESIFMVCFCLPSNKTMTLSTAKITKEWLHNNSVTVLEWPSQSPDLNPIEHLWRDLKMALHQRLPSNLTERERICKEEWQRIPKSRCEKLVASFPKRLMSVLNPKGASTKYRAKGLNT